MGASHQTIALTIRNQCLHLSAGCFFRLNGCKLSWRSCGRLSLLLSSSSSNLRELDLSNNDLLDRGVSLLCDGLRSRRCSLEALRSDLHFGFKELWSQMLSRSSCFHLCSLFRSSDVPQQSLSLNWGNDETSKAELAPVSLQPGRLSADGGRLRCPGLSAQVQPVPPETVGPELQLSRRRGAAAADPGSRGSWLQAGSPQVGRKVLVPRPAGLDLTKVCFQGGPLWTGAAEGRGQQV